MSKFIGFTPAFHGRFNDSTFNDTTCQRKPQRWKSLKSFPDRTAIAEMETAVADGKKELKPSVKERLGEFIDNLANPDSRLRKGINLVTKGAEKAAKLAGFYEKCAKYFDLQQIPGGLFGL